MKSLLFVLFLIFSVIHSVKTDCGLQKIKLKPYISNGYPSEPGDWPWHAAIFHRSGVDISYKCGSTLISSSSVLTAAHCVFEGTSKLTRSRVLVHLGRYKLSEFDEYTISRRVDEIIVHEEFDIFTLSDDIAILKLATEVVYTDFIQPACLWKEDKKPGLIGQRGMVVGWGLNEDDELADVLTQATMPVVDNDICLKMYPQYEEILSDYTYCAGDRNGTSVCSGDSGGGMFLKIGRRWRISGLVSLGGRKNDGNKQVCDANVFVIFTDVFKYLDWIRKNTEIEPESDDIEQDEDVLEDNSVNKTALVNLPNCGLNDLNSTNAIDTNFPWVARIMFTKRFKNGQDSNLKIPMATLINPKYLITTAWYYANYANRENLRKDKAKIVRWYAQIGGFKPENKEKCQGTSFKCPFVQEIDVEAIINHSEYNDISNNNDLSLYRLEKEADISNYAAVNPICLPIGDQFKDDRPKSYFATSWNQVRNTPSGWTDWETELPIMKVDIQDCGDHFGLKKYNPKSKKFCGSKENCTLLDYGVNLQSRQILNGLDRYVLFGLKIEGTSPCDGPDIYVDIAKHVGWILKNIKP